MLRTAYSNEPCASVRTVISICLPPWWIRQHRSPCVGATRNTPSGSTGRISSMIRSVSRNGAHLQVPFLQPGRESRLQVPSCLALRWQKPPDWYGPTLAPHSQPLKLRMLAHSARDALGFQVLSIETRVRELSISILDLCVWRLCLLAQIGVHRTLL